MSDELSPRAKGLVEAGRTAADPTAQDKERVQKALSVQLGLIASGSEALGGDAGAGHPSVAPDPSLVPPPLAGAGSAWLPLAGSALGVGLVAALTYFGLSGNAPGPAENHPFQQAGPAIQEQASALEEPSPPVTEAALPASEASEDVERVPTEDSPSEEPTPARDSAGATDGQSGPPHTRPKAMAPPRVESRLAQEVEILSRATSALNSGRATDALAALAEHQQKFPRGALTLERRVARAHALCLLGRSKEAERELSRLPQSSPQVARVRKLCGSN